LTGPVIRTLALYFRTFRHLKPEQWLAHLPRPRNRSVNPAETVARRPRNPSAWSWQAPPIARGPARTAARRFCFLNQEREIHGWNDAGIPKLWLYNLHSFQTPPDPDLVDRWIAENPPGSGNGWESYPLSLRIVSWIQWILAGTAPPSHWLHSLYAQAAWLSCSVEYRILANHLFTNAKALVFAGVFFEGPRAEAWLRQGLDLLSRELPEQILNDGGHFERSPTYHSLVLEGLLDLINIDPPSAPIPQWRLAAVRMLGWLDRMCHPDGRISFFNDSAFAGAAEPEELQAYAARLHLAAAERTCLGDSGYIRLENRNTVVLFDAGTIGPAYQPAHAHAGTLSFELSHRGRRLLVNSGTSTYEAGPERLRQRGTAAHNTADVDEQNQSEVWGGFRVARRARAFAVQTDHQTFAEASHDGYRRLTNPVIHRRRIELTGEGLRIIDTFDGPGTHTTRLHFHLHPDAAVEIQLDTKLKSQFTGATWHPEFNRPIPNQKVTGIWHGTLPVVFRSFVRLL